MRLGRRRFWLQLMLRLFAPNAVTRALAARLFALSFRLPLGRLPLASRPRRARLFRPALRPLVLRRVRAGALLFVVVGARTSTPPPVFEPNPDVWKLSDCKLR